MKAPYRIVKLPRFEWSRPISAGPFGGRWAVFEYRKGRYLDNGYRYMTRSEARESAGRKA